MLEARIRKFRRQLQESRFRLHNMYEELARPLYDMTFVATKDVWRISTNGKCIYFDPEWLKKLSELELDFILSHELMHIKLGHIERPLYYLGDRYHLAADIVANGKLNTFGWNYEKISHIGKIRYETYFPTIHGSEIESVEAVKYIPIDPSVLEPAKRRQFLIDSEEWWDKKDDSGEGGTIVLSPLDSDPADLQYNGPSFGKKFPFHKEFFPENNDRGEETDQQDEEDNIPVSNLENQNTIKQALRKLRQETEIQQFGIEDRNIERIWGDTKVNTLDWKSLLHYFVQEEVFDYSFTPPDRRMQEQDFFLPDYNVYQEKVRDVYFMVDTSGSVSEEMLSVAYTEIRQALEQFQGSLQGIVAFFDTRVYRAVSFEKVDDIRRVKPCGGGGTDYQCIFEFIHQLHTINQPTSIVIITDGEGVFPDESVTNHIPVLWLMTNENIAPWGRSERIV